MKGPSISLANDKQRQGQTYEVRAAMANLKKLAHFCLYLFNFVSNWPALKWPMTLKQEASVTNASMPELPDESFGDKLV